MKILVLPVIRLERHDEPPPADLSGCDLTNVVLFRREVATKRRRGRSLLSEDGAA